MYTPNIFNDKICYISGMNRSGKSLLVSILPSINKTEIINKDPLLYLISSMNENNEISLKASKHLISVLLTNINYSNHIGRKINLKKVDETSVYKLQNFRKYLKKIDLKKIKKINLEKKNIIFFDIHNILTNLKLWSKINKNFKLINIERHPIELVYSLYKNGFGKHIPTSVTQLLLYKENNIYVPYNAYRWKEKYSTLNKLDRIINEVYFIQKKSTKQFQLYKKKKNILRIKYEDILKNPLFHLKKINKFLGLNSKINFSKYRSTINFNKISNQKNILKKYNFIKNNISKNSTQKLKYLINSYN